MKTAKLILLSSALLVAMSSYAQKMKVKGDLDKLKDVKTIEVAFDYETMSVGKHEKEETYVNEKVEKGNKDEPGKGDKWKEAWVSDREERFEPKFEELINEYLAKENLKAGREYTDAPVKMLIKTYHTEPGFNVGVMRRPAHINVDVLFIDKATGETFGTMNLEKVPGRDAMGYDFDTGYRLQESYAKLGKEVGKYIVKKVF